MQGMIILKPYYFIEGIMLDGVQAYKVALKLHDEFLEDIADLLLDNQSTEESFTFRMARYSRFPIVPLLNNSSPEYCFSPTHMGPDPLRNLFSGDYQPLFSYMKYKFQSGKLASIEETKQLKAAGHDLSDDSNTKIYLDLVKKTSPMDWTQAVGSNLLFMENYRNPMSPFQKYLMDNCYLRDGKITEEGIFMINYLRDFNSDMISDCRMCANEDTTFIGTCHHCDKLIDILTGIKTKKLYGIYG